MPATRRPRPASLLHPGPSRVLVVAPDQPRAAAWLPPAPAAPRASRVPPSYSGTSNSTLMHRRCVALPCSRPHSSGSTTRPHEYCRVLPLAGRAMALLVVPVTLAPKPQRVQESTPPVVCSAAQPPRPAPASHPHTAAPVRADRSALRHPNAAMTCRSDQPAVVAIEGGYQPYQLRLAHLPEASVDAAVATAAHDVLVHSFAAQQAALDSDYAAALAAIPDGVAKNAGIDEDRLDGGKLSLLQQLGVTPLRRDELCTIASLQFALSRGILQSRHTAHIGGHP